MDRNTWRAIGLTLLIPSVSIGLLPLVVAYTDFTESWSSFSWNIGQHVITEYKAPTSDIYVNPAVWAFAAIGELILIGIHLNRPVQKKSRYSLKPY